MAAPKWPRRSGGAETVAPKRPAPKRVRAKTAAPKRPRRNGVDRSHNASGEFVHKSMANVLSGSGAIPSSESILEKHNDELVERLSEKVNALKKITLEIDEDTKEQNRLLDQMEAGFDASEDFIGSSVRRMNTITKDGAKKLLCHLILIGLFSFFSVYYFIL